MSQKPPKMHRHQSLRSDYNRPRESSRERLFLEPGARPRECKERLFLEAGVSKKCCNDKNF